MYSLAYGRRMMLQHRCCYPYCKFFCPNVLECTRYIRRYSISEATIYDSTRQWVRRQSCSLAPACGIYSIYSVETVLACGTND
jgi:hypothetical protein